MRAGTDIGRVRGLGAGRGGTVHHWWAQRVTAAANIGVVIWFIVSLVRLPSLDFDTVTSWLRQPVAAVPMLLLIASVFYHFRLGVQVMIEDYLHDEGSKILAILLLNFYAIAAAAISAFSVLKIAFGD